jgi:hypothetical protein
LFVLVGHGVWTQDFTLTKQVLYCLSHTSKSILLCQFWRWGLENYLPGLVLNHDPPDIGPKELGLQMWATGTWLKFNVSLPV